VRAFLWAAACALTIFAQTSKKPFQAQASSTISYGVQGGAETVQISNVWYETAARLLLRKTTRTKETIGDKGIEATSTVEAWRLGVDLREKALYKIAVEGVDPRIVGGDLLTISRGLEETEWWSVYQLGSGAHLFDTYTPLQQASIARETLKPRYAGLDVPADDAKDARLKAPNVVGVLVYASGERVIREALITSDDPKRATILRSYADASRTLTFTPQNVTVSISQNYPSAPATVTITVPVARDDLDIARARASGGIHVTAWKR